MVSKNIVKNISKIHLKDTLTASKDIVNDIQESILWSRINTSNGSI